MFSLFYLKMLVMKKFLLLVAVALMANASVNAEKRTKSQLLSVASEVLQDKGLKTVSANNANDKLQILDNSFAHISIVGYKNGSYVVVANDDEIPAVIGYSDKAVSYDSENMAPAFKWYLETVNRNIQECLANGTTLPMTGVSPEFKPEVPMLCQTQWSQGEPYNRLTPTFSNGGYDEHYVTGCVATAMAQAMKYYNYPEQGRGRIKYSFNSDEGSTEKVSMRFDEEPFDWDNMLNQYYTYKYNDDQAYAVAYLMKSTGASVRMGYHINGSGAFTIDAASAFYTFFKYDIATECYHKDFLCTDEWFDIAYRSLSNGHPLIFGASSSIGGQDAGHSFVVDGYNADGLVHVNFGWAGDSDGYYSLLDMHGYDHGFEMIPLKKPSEDSHITSLWGQWQDNLSYNTVTGATKVNIINSSARDFSGKIAVILKNLADGSEQMLGYMNYTDEGMIKDGNYYNVINYAVEAPLPEDLKDGDYRLFLASKGAWKVKDDPTDRHAEEKLVEEATWQPVRASDGFKNSILITVSNGEVTSKADKNSNWVLGIENIVNENHASDVVRVYDVQGRMVYTSSADNFRIADVPAEGMLIIKNGSEVRKVIK